MKHVYLVEGGASSKTAIACESKDDALDMSRALHGAASAGLFVTAVPYVPFSFCTSGGLFRDLPEAEEVVKRG